jgi:hypothetical protein
MSCTCSKRQLPCPIHGEKGLPQPESVEHHCIVVRVYQRDTGKWYATITDNAIQVIKTSDRENKPDAMLEVTCFLTSMQKPKPKEK